MNALCLAHTDLCGGQAVGMPLIFLRRVAELECLISEQRLVLRESQNVIPSKRSGWPAKSGYNSVNLHP
jgi:hypothetical protein